MKRFWLILFSFLFLWWFCVADLAWYTIQSYTAEYDLQKNWTLKVKEIIDVSFYEYRHGIYRDIPYKYNNNLSTPIKNVKVPWEKFSTSKIWNNFQIRIWDKEKNIIWKHKYTIEYDIKKTIRSISWWQELYRNLLWLEWNTPVNNYYFKLQLPKDIKISNEDFHVVYWPKWSQEKLDAHIENNSIIIDHPINIWANQAVTIGIKFPPNTLKKSILDKISDFIALNYEKIQKTTFWKTIKFFILIIKGIFKVIFSIILIFLIIFFLIISHFSIVLEPKHLRMRRKNLKDIIYYTPPKWYSPIEINLLYNRYPSTQIITTALYTRVSEWYMKIYSKKRSFWATWAPLFEVIKEKEEFWKDKRDSFKNDLEKELWNSIKKINYNNYIITDNLENIKDISNRMFISLRHEFISESYKKYENTKQTKLPWTFFWLWFFLSFILFLKYFNHPSVNTTFLIFSFYTLRLIFWFLILYLLQYYKAWREYKKNDDEIYLNEKWKEILQQIHWFRKFLLFVEDEKINKLLKEDPKYCEKMLPYAIALWIWNKWIKKCKWFSDKFSIEALPSEFSNSTREFGDSRMLNWVISDIEASQSASGGWNWWSDWGSSSWFDSWWSSSWSSWWWWGWGWWWSW